MNRNEEWCLVLGVIKALKKAFLMLWALTYSAMQHDPGGRVALLVANWSESVDYVDSLCQHQRNNTSPC